MANELQVLIDQSGLQQSKAQYLLERFTEYFEVAADWERRVREIVVTDASQTGMMKMARAGRLFLRNKRIAIEAARIHLKEQSLREGKAIDGIANILKALIVPIEEHLYKQEHFVELRVKAEEERVRIEAEKRAEQKRLAEQEALFEERERIRRENEYLRKEAETREKKLQQEKARRIEAMRKKKAAEARAKRAKIKVAKTIEEQTRSVQQTKKPKDYSVVICPFCNGTFRVDPNGVVIA